MVQVQVHHGLKIGCFLSGVCCGGNQDASVVDQHVKFADRCRRSCHRFLIRNIELAPVDARVLEITRGRAMARVDYFRRVLQDRLAERSPQTAVSAGDKYRAIFEIKPWQGGGHRQEP